MLNYFKRSNRKNMFYTIYKSIFFLLYALEKRLSLYDIESCGLSLGGFSLHSCLCSAIFSLSHPLCRKKKEYYFTFPAFQMPRFPMKLESNQITIQSARDSFDMISNSFWYSAFLPIEMILSLTIR